MSFVKTCEEAHPGLTCQENIQKHYDELVSETYAPGERHKPTCQCSDCRRKTR